MKLNKSISGNERGQILVLTGLMLAVLIGAVGLSIDVGFMMHTRTELQKDADAMALAGAQELCAPSPCGQDKADNKAREWGVKNGITPSDPSPAIQFGVDCDGGTNNPYVITVRVKRYQASFFARVLGFSGGDIGACATAGRFAVGGLSGARPFALEDNCVVELDIGKEIVLKHDSSSTRDCDAFQGNYGSLAIDGTGSDVFRESIEFGTDSVICSDAVPGCTNYGFNTQTGNEIGPLKQGLDYVYANTPSYCDEWEEVVQDGKISPACDPWREDYPGPSTRLWVIPVVDGLWDAGGNNHIIIKKFAIVFLLPNSCKQGNDCDIWVKFVEFSVNLPGVDRLTLYDGATATAIALIK